MVDMDASNQEETMFSLAADTSGPSSSNLQTIPKPIQLDSHATSSGCIASSSTATSARRRKYDVFLSFRGPDTRKGITSAIRERLKSRGVRTFMDDEDLHVGDTIYPTLIAAIEESQFAIVVLSQNYASSTWCLEELVKICECMASEERILPILYHVHPTEVRYQKKGTFKEAFSKHETSGRHEPETVEKWRAALRQVADISGWSLDDFTTDGDLVDKIVETLGSKTSPNAIEFTDNFHSYEATTKAIHEVKEALRDEEINWVGVYGMGGVGKTSLVRHVAAQACRDGTFNQWIIATVSQNPNITQIQGTLSDLLGVRLGVETEDGRAARLHKEIMRREKLLIILDDVWNIIKLDKVGIPNSSELHYCNSKIILTTRRRNICHAMNCQQTINLTCLSKQDSWTLFLRKERCSLESPTFEDVARKVAGECKGLPIALITVAMALGDKDLEEWKIAAKQLEKSQSANLDDNGEAFECIKLSYDYLKDDEYKSFFLLCCLFPEDSSIEIDQVFKYGMGIGLFQHAETLKEGYDKAVSLVKHLRYSSLLLDKGDTYARLRDFYRDPAIQSDKYLRLHDVVRDAGIRIAESERNFFVEAGCGLKAWPRQIHKVCTAISLMKNDIRKLPEDLVCPKLQILLLNQNYYIEEIPETFFQSPNDLRVLDLNDRHRLSLLPQSISLLTNLTFLSLLECDYLTSDISILGNLKKLEILYLSSPYFEELPVELGGLTNLRIFSFSINNYQNEYIQIIPPRVISEWKKLEELHIKGFGLWGCKVRGEETKNAGFEEVTSLPKLRVLRATVFYIENLPEHVDLVPEWAEFTITIGISPHNYDSSSGGKSIELVLDNISDLPEWFRDGLMKRAESLYWKGCKNLSDIFVDLEHGRLPKLRHMYMRRFSASYVYEKATETEDETEESFTEIEKSSKDDIGESFSHDESHRNPLTIPVLQNLEELSLVWLDCEKSLEAVQTLPPGSLLNLKQLYLEGCYADGNALISLAKLQILSNLERIHIDSTSKRYIFRHDELFVSLQLNIRKITLDSCSMIGICEGRAPPTIFQNLQSLEIWECHKLEGSLFTHEVAQCLPQLDKLELRDCTLLERIVDAGSNKTILPKLSYLYLLECPLLYCESGSLDIECPSLETFFLLECPKFAASFDDFNSRIWRSCFCVGLTVRSHWKLFKLYRLGLYLISRNWNYNIATQRGMHLFHWKSCRYYPIWRQFRLFTSTATYIYLGMMSCLFPYH